MRHGYFLISQNFNFSKGNEECTSVIAKPHPLISYPIALHPPGPFTNTVFFTRLPTKFNISKHSSAITIIEYLRGVHVGKVSAYPFRRGECCNISAIKSFLKSVFNRILSIVCAMKFAFMICNRGKAKLMLLCSVRIILWHTAFLGSAVLCFALVLVLHLECLIIDAYFNSISF